MGVLFELYVSVVLALAWQRPCLDMVFDTYKPTTKQRLMAAWKVGLQQLMCFGSVPGVGCSVFDLRRRGAEPTASQASRTQDGFRS